MNFRSLNREWARLWETILKASKSRVSTFNNAGLSLSYHGRRLNVWSRVDRVRAMTATRVCKLHLPRQWRRWHAMGPTASVIDFHCVWAAAWNHKIWSSSGRGVACCVARVFKLEFNRTKLNLKNLTRDFSILFSLEFKIEVGLKLDEDELQRTNSPRLDIRRISNFIDKNRRMRWLGQRAAGLRVEINKQKIDYIMTVNHSKNWKINIWKKIVGHQSFMPFHIMSIHAKIWKNGERETKWILPVCGW